MNESLKIILNQFKKKNITEEEAIKLILDVTNNNRWYYPYYINNFNDNNTIPFTTTCSNEDNTMSKVQE